MAFVGIPYEFIDDVVAARVDPVMWVRRFIGGIRRRTVRSFVPTETQQIPRTVNFGSSWICMKTTLEKTGFSDGQRSVEASV